MPPSASSTSQSSDDRALAERGEVGDRAQRAADQALDLLRAPAGLAACAACARRSRAAACRTRPSPSRGSVRAASSARGPRPWRVHITRVRPIEISAEPSACGSTPRSILSGRGWPRLARPSCARTARLGGARLALADRARLAGHGVASHQALARVRAFEPRQIGLIHDRDARQRRGRGTLSRDAREIGAARR